VYRWRQWSGIEKSYFVQTVIIANIVFYHFSQTASALPMFARIFATGLFFALLFQRSGNL
jgi:hypothetical protein